MLEFYNDYIHNGLRHISDVNQSNEKSDLYDQEGKPDFRAEILNGNKTNLKKVYPFNLDN